MFHKHLGALLFIALATVCSFALKEDPVEAQLKIVVSNNQITISGKDFSQNFQRTDANTVTKKNDLFEIQEVNGDITITGSDLTIKASNGILSINTPEGHQKMTLDEDGSIDAVQGRIAVHYDGTVVTITVSEE